MNVDSILVSQSAVLSNGAVLNVVGVFNQVFSPTFPVMLPNLALSAVIHGARSEGGSEHEVEIVLLDQRRNPVADTPVKVKFNFPEAHTVPEGIPLRHTLTLNAANIVFSEPGPYAFEIYIDGVYSGGSAFFIGLQSQV